MIKIIKESKQDWEIFKQALKDSLPFEISDKTLENTINDFKKYRDFFPNPEEKDLGYWIKLSKRGEEAYELLAKEIRKVQEDKLQKERYKKFCDYFPSNLVRSFIKNQDKIKEKFGNSYASFGRWVIAYEKDKVKAVEDLKRIVRKFGYDEADMSKINKGSELLANVSGFDIYKITSYLASEYYGQNTGWCISGNYPGHENRGETHFYNYMEQREFDCYYFLIKNFKEAGEEDYCLFFEDESFEEDGYEIWDGTDGQDDQTYYDWLDEDVKKAVDYVLQSNGISTTEDDIKKEVLALLKIEKDYVLKQWNNRTYNRLVRQIYNFDEIFKYFREMQIQRRLDREKIQPRGWTREEIEEVVDDSLNQLGIDNFTSEELIENIWGYFMNKYGTSGTKFIREFLKFLDITDEKLAEAIVSSGNGQRLLNSYKRDNE